MGWLLLSVVCLAYWAAQALGSWLLWKVPQLSDVDPGSLDRWPKLSLVIPARDEAEQIEAAVQSRLEDGYPDLEIVLVDDRSTDGTSEIVDRLAASDPRVRALHIRELPPGWLGKLNAMQRGLELTHGEWVLFTDADIHFRPGTLRRAMALCQARGLDHLSVIPGIWPVGFLLDCVAATFLRSVALVARLWAVEDPKSKAAMGAGAFNLVRRSAFERTAGFEWLRLEAADDVALGQMLKRSGARSGVALGRDMVELPFSRTLNDVERSAEKSAGHFGFRIWPVFVAIGSLAVLELGPFALLPLPIWGPARILAATAALVAIGTSIAACIRIGVRRFPAIFVPLGSAVFLVLMAKAATNAALNKAVRWRGTSYSAEEILAGRRVALR